MGSDMKRIPLRAAGGGGARVPQTQARQGGGSPRGRGFNRALPVRVPPCPPVSPRVPPVPPRRPLAPPVPRAPGVPRAPPCSINSGTGGHGAGGGGARSVRDPRGAGSVRGL